MMNDTKKLEQHLKSITVHTTPDTDRRILSAVLTRFDHKTKTSHPAPAVYQPDFKPWYRQSWLKMAVAASLIIALITGIINTHNFSKSSPAALEKIAATMHKSPWIEISYQEQTGNRTAERKKWLNTKEKKVFTAEHAGDAWCLDYRHQVQYSYNATSDIITISKLPQRGLFYADAASNTLKLIMENYHPDKSRIRHRQDYRNQTSYDVYEVTRSFTEANMPEIRQQPVATAKHTLVVDAGSNRVVEGNSQYLDRQNNPLASIALDVSYPQTGPSNIYDLNVPMTAAIIDTTRANRPGTPIYDSTPGEYIRNLNARLDEREAETPSRKPLKLKLPEKQFEGTPQNLRGIHNLQRPRIGQRPPFYVPEGTELVSRKDPVIIADELIFGSPEMLTDGDKEAMDGSYVELETGLQSITLDLGQPCDIYAILIWHYHMEARVYYDVIVQIADNAAFTENVRTLFNNDHDNSAGLGIGSDLNYIESYEGKLIDGYGYRARYVRFYSNGNNDNDYNHYCEVEVYGMPIL